MLFWILLGVAIWLSVAIIFYISDGWFDYGAPSVDALITAALTWPLWFWFVIPFILIDNAHTSLKAKRNKRLEEKERQNKIRLDAEAEVKRVEEQLASYSEEEIEKVRCA